MTMNFIDIKPDKESPDELTPQAAEWQDLMEEEDQKHHEFRSYIDAPYEDYPNVNSLHSERDIKRREDTLAKKIKGINDDEQARRGEFIEKNGRKPSLREGGLLAAEKLEDIASWGIRRLGWLGELSPEEAYDEGYIAREIGLAESDESRHQITDMYGRTYSRPFDDIVNKIDSAWELARQDGQSLYLGLDFSVNDGRGRDDDGHKNDRASLSGNRAAALERDRYWTRKITRSTNSPIKLPFGCSSITFGYSKLESAAVNPNISVRIVPRYTIAIGSDDTNHVYNSVHSPNGVIDRSSADAMQFKILSQIHEQNQLLIPVIGRTALGGHGDRSLTLTPEEKRTLEMIEGIDEIVQHQLQNCMVSIFNYGLNKSNGDERRDRRIGKLKTKLQSLPRSERIPYLYEWLRDGSISLILRGNGSGKTIGSDDSYNECIEMTRRLTEALDDPQNHDAISKLFGLENRSSLPFKVVENTAGDHTQLKLEVR